MRVEAAVTPMLHRQSGEEAIPASFKQATEKAIAALESYQSWLEQNLDKMRPMRRWAVRLRILSEPGCPFALHPEQLSPSALRSGHAL